MLVLVMVLASLLTVAERKWSAAMQDRIGANRIKVFGSAIGGIPYLLADALKMLTKENTVPATRSRLLFELAPVLSFVPVFALFAVVPVGPQVTVLGQKVGKAQSQSLMWLVAWGDAGTAAAAKDGSITTVNHMDQEVFSVLFGLYTKTTTVVYGE
jgi:NADH:ubiquinone oxidoreductase subunit H